MIAAAAAAASQGLLVDNGETEPLTYLEMLDIGARSIGVQAAWAGREGWVQRGGRTVETLRAACFAVWLAMAEAVAAPETEGSISAMFRGNFGGLSAAKSRFRKAGGAIVAGSRIGAGKGIRERAAGPPRKLAAPLMVLPDRLKYPAYYDIIRECHGAYSFPPARSS
eukprot:SAG11_NODE_5823_length_1456_cov_0.831245_1_plen_166_part_10